MYYVDPAGDVRLSGRVAQATGSTTSYSLIFTVTLDGIAFHVGGAPGADWTTLAPSSPWANVESTLPLPPLAYRVDCMSVVHFQGVLRDPTAPSFDLELFSAADVAPPLLSHGDRAAADGGRDRRAVDRRR